MPITCWGCEKHYKFNIYSGLCLILYSEKGTEYLGVKKIGILCNRFYWI